MAVGRGRPSFYAPILRLSLSSDNNRREEAWMRARSPLPRRNRMKKNAETTPRSEMRDGLNRRQLEELQEIIDRLKRELSSEIKAGG